MFNPTNQIEFESKQSKSSHIIAPSFHPSLQVIKHSFSVQSLFVFETDILCTVSTIKSNPTKIILLTQPQLYHEIPKLDAKHI